jgi:hypothetical protein
VLLSPEYILEADRKEGPNDESDYPDMRSLAAAPHCKRPSTKKMPRQGGSG